MNTQEEIVVLEGTTLDVKQAENLVTYMNDEVRENLHDMNFDTLQAFVEAYCSVAWLVDRSFINILVDEFSIDMSYPSFESAEDMYAYLQLVQRAKESCDYELQLVASAEVLQANAATVRETLNYEEEKEFDFTKPYIYVQGNNGDAVLQYPHFHDVRQFYRCYMQ